MEHIEIVEPKVEYLPQVKLFKLIELAGRVCYKSENKITETSAIKFVKMLCDRGHTSATEHGTVYFTIPDGLFSGPWYDIKYSPFSALCKYDSDLCFITTNFRVVLNAFNGDFEGAQDFVIKNAVEPTQHELRYTFRIICDRGVSHELVRHRTFSFSQECLSGDTVIHYTGLTIKELFERASTCYGKTHNKTIWLRSVDDKGQIVPNKMVQVWDKGTGEVYEVVTRTGYKIKATMNHRFLCRDGSYKTLSELSSGDFVAVNGRPFLISVSDERLIEMYETLSIGEIASLIGSPAASVDRRLRQLGVWQYRKNADNHPEKYNKGKTQEVLAASAHRFKEWYANGGEVWNKGLTEDNPSVKRQADALRAHHYSNKSGEENSNWHGGISKYREMKKDISYCELCGVELTKDEFPNVHHIDGNRNNNELRNLIKLCTKCHRMVHSNKFFEGVRVCYDEIVSISYVGVEPVYDIQMADPMNNFVANGFIVHNSTRYVNYNNRGFQFVQPSWWSENAQEDLRHSLFISACQNAANSYADLIRLGSTPQQARAVLPNATKTEVIVTGTSSQWDAFLQLRTAATAHPDMRVIANKIKQSLDILRQQKN